MIRINKEFLNYIDRLQKKDADGIIQEQKVLPGKKIIKQQTKIFNLFVIKSGMAKCYMKEDTGNDFIQEFFAEGEVFGEIELFNNDPCFCTIEALTTMTVFKIKKKDFFYLIENDATFNKLVLKLMASKIKYTAIRHSYNQSHQIESNINRLTAQFPELFQKIPKRDIANYLGITVRSLNRALQNINGKTL